MYENVPYPWAVADTCECGTFGVGCTTDFDMSELQGRVIVIFGRGPSLLNVASRDDHRSCDASWILKIRGRKENKKDKGDSEMDALVLLVGLSARLHFQIPNDLRPMVFPSLFLQISRGPDMLRFSRARFGAQIRAKKTPPVISHIRVRIAGCFSLETLGSPSV